MKKEGFDQNLVGVVFAILSAVTYGAVTTLGKKALTDASPVVISSFAYLVGAAVLFSFRPKQPLPSGMLPITIVAGLLGATAGPLLFFEGLSMTTASNAALLSNGEAVFTTILGIVFFKERLKRNQIVAVGLVIASLIVITTNLDLSSISFMEGLQGNLLVLSATFMWGLDNNVSRIATQRMEPTVFTRYKNIVGGLMLSIVLLFDRGTKYPSYDSLPYIMVIGIFAVGLSTAFLMHALRRLGAIRAVMLFSTASFFGLLFASLFLHESVTPVQLTGAFVMFLGLYALSRRPKEAS